jgi:hypothetical protein
MDDVVAELEVGQLQERPSRQNCQNSLHRGINPTSFRTLTLHHLTHTHATAVTQVDYYGARFAEMIVVAAKRPISPNKLCFIPLGACLHTFLRRPCSIICYRKAESLIRRCQMA